MRFFIFNILLALSGGFDEFLDDLVVISVLAVLFIVCVVYILLDLELGGEVHVV
jgi:hypothetical protein